MNINVLKDRILIENIKVEKKAGSIILMPTSETETVLTGKVLKVGKLVEDIKENNTIRYEKHNALPIDHDGKEYFILREYDVIAIV